MVRTRTQHVLVGDIVLLVEDSPRNYWPLARILEVLPGDAGLVGTKSRLGPLISYGQDVSSGERTGTLIKSACTSVGTFSILANSSLCRDML